jgi:hypothetical protein
MLLISVAMTLAVLNLRCIEATTEYAPSIIKCISTRRNNYRGCNSRGELPMPFNARLPPVRKKRRFCCLTSGMMIIYFQVLLKLDFKLLFS